MPKPLPLQLPGWAFGEVVGYHMANGKYALLHALNYRATRTRLHGVIPAIDWAALGEGHMHLISLGFIVALYAVVFPGHCHIKEVKALSGFDPSAK